MRQLATLIAVAVIASCASGEPEQQGPSASSRSSQIDGSTIRYDVNFNGIDDDAVKSSLRSVSNAEVETSNPPSSSLMLKRRAQNDIPRLREALRGLGFYEGRVQFAIQDHPPPIVDPVETLDLATDATIIFNVETGPQYRFDDLKIDVDTNDEIELPKLRDIGFRQSEKAKSSAVLETERVILASIKTQGFPFATTDERTAIVDFDQKTMDVALAFKSGPKTPFGPISISGIDGIDQDFLRARLNFEDGDPYDPRRIREARQRLIETGLFSTVRAIEADKPDRNGRLPVQFEATQRKHRSIGGGVGFRTDEGPGVRLFWEHRNLLEAGERLRLGIEGNQIRGEATALFRKPDFLSVDQALLANGGLKRENTDAFSSKSAEAGIGIERIFNRHITGSLGVAYRFADIEDNNDQQIFGLLSVPANLMLDYSDDLLDPTEGWRLRLFGAPFVDMLGIGRNFVRARAIATQYVRFLNEPRTVLALRGAIGSVIGAQRTEIPADERFYSGGGGSVRGIGFQLAGPVDAKNDPLGGTALLEFGSEIRIKAFGDVELVSFLDGGTVYSSRYPDGSEDIRYGAGIGARYITPIGPLRFDVGIPLDKRRRVDDPFQFYLSIGQAF